MNDDARKVSAREWRAVREGDTHAAPKTSPNNTPESFIVGVGASGALLAGAAIVFVTLVGLVSFNVWPTAQDASTDGNVELSAATPSAPAHSTVAPLSAAAGLVASTNVGPPTGGPSGGGNGGGKNPGGKGNPKPGPAPTPPTTSPSPAPPDTGGGSTGGPVTAIKDPSVAVTPTHPSNPHQSTSTGEKGKDPADEDDGGVSGIIGKPPIVKPPAVAVTQPVQTPPSSGSDGDNGDDGSTPPDDNDDGSSQGGDGHGCSHSHHHGD
jgi:hypothetical protein